MHELQMSVRKAALSSAPNTACNPHTSARPGYIRDGHHLMAPVRRSGPDGGATALGMEVKQIERVILDRQSIDVAGRVGNDPERQRYYSGLCQQHRVDAPAEAAGTRTAAAACPDAV